MADNNIEESHGHHSGQDDKLVFTIPTTEIEMSAGANADHEQALTQGKDDDQERIPCSSNEAEIKPQLQDMPEEILERILGFLSNYDDQDRAKTVCHQWNRVVKSVVRQAKRIFYQRLSASKIGWTEIVQVQKTNKGAAASSSESYFRLPSITERFSHSCAYLNGSMYVFGGCTATNTTFNDLWRLDLTTRKWVRPVAMGSYPSPKACASMVIYREKLVLFGGWSHPIPYPLHQSANYFSELHVYDPATNRWSLLLSIGREPDALGGHSASIIGDLMVVFGGSPKPGQGSNKIWVYDFIKSIWYNPKVKPGVYPEPRYGQFQCTLNDRQILIMGGCGGPNKIYSDFFILTVDSEDAWFWTKISVQHPEYAPRQTWCHAVCKVKEKIVVLCKSNKSRECLNVKPSVCRVEAQPRQKTVPSECRFECSSSAPQLTEQTSPEKAVPVLPAAKSDNTLQASNTSMEDPSPEESLENQSIPPADNRNLLALQQRLHRECVNLSDKHGHHSLPDSNVPEGQIHRLQNRAGHLDDANVYPSQPQPFSPQVHPNNRALVHQEFNQPHAGQLLRRMNSPAVRGNAQMPSIRPNASSNRQKQLEALQRQEELLRSKSKALAAERKKSLESSADVSMEEDTPPATVATQNLMDVHVVDISSVLSSNTVEWQSESLLQPVGAPMETMCCSLVEGRAELILFGGIGRETTVPMDRNIALNKLYIMHA